MEFHTHKFVTANQKWGESQQNGTPGGLVSFSYAEMNYIEQFSDFNDFIIQNEFQLAILNALKEWSTVADIHFHLVPDAANVDIRIGWADFDGPGGVLGDATIPSLGPLASSTIRLDKSENWGFGNNQSTEKVDFSTTVLHEIGHSLGVLHSDLQNVLMSEVYSASVSTLREDDIEAIRFIYGPHKDTVDVHRYFNSSNGGHFFTSDEAEKQSVSDIPNIIDEGTIFQVLSRDEEAAEFFMPVYRFFNKEVGGHFFTTSEIERLAVTAMSEFRFEGVAFKASSIETVLTKPIYRFFNSLEGGHFFTASTVERDAVENLAGFNYEGVAFYAYIESGPKVVEQADPLDGIVSNPETSFESNTTPANSEFFMF